MSNPIGVQNNNPGNVRWDGVSNWQGLAVKPTKPGEFLKPIDVPSGFRIFARNIIAHFDDWHHDTIAKLIGGTGPQTPGWAPPEDNNNTPAYIASVAAQTGFAADQVLDFHQYECIKPVIVAMATVEQGAPPSRWGWTDAQINEGLRRVGVIPPAKPLPIGRLVTGAAASIGTAAGTAVTNTTPAPTIQTQPIPDLSQAQDTLSMLAPYFKWAAVALILITVASVGYYFWKQHQNRKQGVA